MSIAVVLPSLGESVVEGTISQWLVKEGDHVERDQPLVEVTTDKVDVEIPSPAAGIVQRIVASEGEVVPIGAELARIDPKAHANRKGSAALSHATAGGAPTPADSAAAVERPALLGLDSSPRAGLSSFGMSLRGFFTLAGCVLLADQLTKIAVLQWLSDGEPITIIPSLLQLNYATNTGAAF
ncbi:MAG: biotin/lipoyl-binding protein, partial [Myxococcales bacterium]|nr:biotin/lipoyl-binding protein [Myxococcales bacterium]